MATWGIAGWRIVGFLLAIFLVYATIVAFSGLVIPLLFACVVAALGVPVVDRLERRRIPRQIGAMLLIVGIVAVLAGATIILIRGIIQESGEIRSVVIAGADDVRDWVADGQAEPGSVEGTYDNAIEQGRPLLSGAATWATTVFSSAMAFSIGIFLAMFMLYYLLVDWSTVRLWLSRHLGLPPDLGTAVIDDATDVVRRGFGALTVTSLITSALIGLAMLILDVPLALAVAIVTFVTSYVPYLGAILSGTFGFLVALGAGGVRDAVILVIVIVVVQNIVQTIVSNRLTSDRLGLHPLPSIISSVCGIAVAGFVGAMLSAPALALTLAVSRRVGGARDELAAGDGIVADREASDPETPRPAAER